MEQIRLGLERGLEVKYYANPKFNLEQMYFIKQALENEEYVETFAIPELTVDEMEVVSCCAKNNIDIMKLAKKMKKL